MVYSKTAVGGGGAGNVYNGKSGHLYFHFCNFEARNDAFEVKFSQGFVFTPYHRHWYKSM